MLGTGWVGRAIGGKVAEIGHEATIGTRDPVALMARTEPDAPGRPPFSVWHADHPQVGVGTFADVARDAELIVNATEGAASLEVLTAAGEANLDGKVLIDISNPLDFSHGMPPSLFVCNTDSLGEQIQAAFPGAKVVKTLNTVTAGVIDRSAQHRGRRAHGLPERERRRRESRGHGAAQRRVRVEARDGSRRYRVRPGRRDGAPALARDRDEDERSMFNFSVVR